MAGPGTSLVFTVRRCQPELVAPAKPTPHEFKPLSDIDDQETLRCQIPIIQFYRYDPSMQGKDPANVIREALAQALVFYYPFAGRLREGPGRKLVVECTGEGIMFIEADADATLHQFGDALQPPFPLQELLYDVPGSAGILNCPLLLIQVTRLKCGGFIFAVRLNHTITDGTGLVHFLMAVAEMAHGAHTPSISPVWQRHLLSARDPPRVTCIHRECEEVPDTEGNIIPLENMVHRSFFFGPTEMSTIRGLLPPHRSRYTTFEVLTAFLWRCRTLALQPDSDEEVRMLSVINARTKFNPPLPIGYYGNTFAFSPAVTTAGKLFENPLSYAVELVRQSKNNVTDEYMQSLADMMAIKGRPHVTGVRSFLLSDLTKLGFLDTDFGWGKPVYSGAASGGVGAIPGMVSFFVPFKNNKGEEGIVVPLCLPAPAMERFVKELDCLFTGKPKTGQQNSSLRAARL